MIVGGLLLGGLALGAGTAAAESGDTSAAGCTYLGKSYDPAKYPGLVSNDGVCGSDSSKTVGEILGLSGTSDTTSTTTAAAPTSTVAAPAAGSPRHARPVAPRVITKVVQAPAVAAPLPAPAVVAPRAAVAAPPALLPALPAPALTGGLAPAGPAGAPLPGGLSSNLFSANLGNPALLAGTPFGSAAAGLYLPQADSAVTTVSHTQALAADDQKGVSTPMAVAAIALACVVGLLVRTGVLRRINRREFPAGVLVEEPGVVEVSAPAGAPLAPVPTPAPAAAA